MGHLVTAERVPSRIGKKCSECLGLFFLRASPTTSGEWLSPTVTDQGGYSAIRGIGEETERAETIGRFAWLAFRRGARCGNQFPRAHKLVVYVHEYTHWEAIYSSIKGIAVLILILHLILIPQTDSAPSKKDSPHWSGSVGS